MSAELDNHPDFLNPCNEEDTRYCIIVGRLFHHVDKMRASMVAAAPKAGSKLTKPTFYQLKAAIRTVRYQFTAASTSIVPTTGLLNQSSAQVDAKSAGRAIIERKSRTVIKTWYRKTLIYTDSLLRKFISIELNRRQMCRSLRGIDSDDMA